MDWQHPQEWGKGGFCFLGLHENRFAYDAAEWDLGNAKWNDGLIFSYNEKAFIPRSEHEQGTWVEYEGERPAKEDYMPDWPAELCVGWQMYETTSEGTPLSPVLESPEALAKWLAENGASSFGNSTVTEEQWLSTIKRGFAPSAIFSHRGLESGVEALARDEAEKS
jgi:hypothetical protein